MVEKHLFYSIYPLSYMIYEGVSVIVSIANNKGGTGKTTISVNLAAYLAASKNRVLLVDLDSQSAATRHLGYDFRKTMHVATIYDSLIGERSLADVVMDTGVPLLRLVPSNLNLSGAEYELHGVKDREHALKRALSTLKDGYDFIVVDCPPSFGTLSINALAASDLIIIPILAEFLSLSGLASLLEIFKLVEEKLHKKVSFKILFSMYDRRLRLSREVFETVKKHFGDKVFKTVIPRNVTVAEAAGHGVPLAVYNNRCNGARAFMALAQEVMEVVAK